MSTPTVPAPAAPDALEPIKHVTTTEAELDAKIAGFRTMVKAALEEAQRETESLLLQARTDADKEREATLATAIREGDLEVQRILKAGADRAATIRSKSAAELAPIQGALLTAVLAEFRPAGKRPSA
jgi:vacuolar-type H+-ATPase subunit H